MTTSCVHAGAIMIDPDRLENTEVISGLFLSGHSAESANSKVIPVPPPNPDPMPQKMTWVFQGLEEDERKKLTPTERLMYELSMINPAYKNPRSVALAKDHMQHLAAKDAQWWQGTVKRVELEGVRTSFLGEYFAHSGEAVVCPVEGIGALPNEGRKHPGIETFAYRPDRDKHGRRYPDSLTLTSYVMSRGAVPKLDDPWAIYIC
jgi:hypothetical protein